MPYLICYDITSNKKRNQASRFLIQSGLVRIQKSVFIGSLSSSGLEGLKNRLQKLKQKNPGPEDKVHILKIHQQAATEMTMIGAQMDMRFVLASEKVIFL